MHMHQKDRIEKMKTRVLEKHFIQSSHGDSFRVRYNQMNEEMKRLEDEYNTFWRDAEPHFVEYLKTMGGED